jgi:hypothetical protein
MGAHSAEDTAWMAFIKRILQSGKDTEPLAADFKLLGQQADQNQPVGAALTTEIKEVAGDLDWVAQELQDIVAAARRLQPRNFRGENPRKNLDVEENADAERFRRQQ